jgi:hypothetical protein
MAVKKKAAAKRPAPAAKAAKASRGLKAPNPAEAVKAAPLAAPAKSRSGLITIVAVVAVLGGLAFQSFYMVRAKAAMQFDLQRAGKIIAQGLGDGQATGPRALAADPQGDVFFLDGQERPVERLQKFSPSMDFVAKYQPKTVEASLGASRAMAIDEQGTLYLLVDDKRVLVIDNALKFVRVFPIQVAEASAIAADSGKVYVSSRSDNKVAIYGTDGAPEGEFGAPGTKTGDLANPALMNIGPKGELVVLEAIEPPRIKVFDKSHALVKTFNALDLTMAPPVMMGTDNAGFLYFNDPSGANGVLIYKLSSGKLIGQVKGTVQGDLFIFPGGIGANRFTGTVYVHTVPGLIPCTLPAGH